MNKFKTFIFILLLSILFSPMSFGQDGVPSTTPPSNISNITLLSQDFVSATFKNRTNYRDLRWAGWPTDKEISTWADVVQGLYESWAFPNKLFIGIKYGYFDTPLAAEKGSFKAIAPWLRSSYVTLPLDGSFSGTSIGDKVFHWELALELPMGRIPPNIQKDTVILSFSKGKYAAMVVAGSDNIPIGGIDKSLVENLGKKMEKKIDVATSLDNFNTDLPKLINQQGILRSLQAKLDAYTKHYRKGDYQAALNEINAFMHELNAQRGKHVSESAYQTLKGYADTVVQSLNSLMEANSH